MSPLGKWLMALALLAASPAAAGEPRGSHRFAPGTGNSCASYCSQRWNSDPASARICATGCVTRSFSGTSYFLGGGRDDRVECSERLVRPPGVMDECASRQGSPQHRAPRF